MSPVGILCFLQDNCRGNSVGVGTWDSDEWQGVGSKSRYFTRLVYVGFYVSNHVKARALHNQCIQKQSSISNR